MLLLVLLAGGSAFGSVPASADTPPSPVAVHLAAAAPATRGLSIRLLDYLDSQKSDLRAHEYIVQTSQPGTTLTRHIEISNTTGTSQQVRIYAGGASIAGGSFDIGKTSQDPLSTWIHPSMSLVTLADGSHTDVTVVITIPVDAARGEQYAVVWAELRAPASASSGSGAVTVVNRVGIRAYINVDSPATANATFRIDSVTSRARSNAPTVLTHVTNPGDVAVDITGTVNLSNGPGSTSAGPFATSETTSLAPGQQATIVTRLPAALAAGPWTVRVQLASGQTTRVATARITFPQNRSASHKTPTTWVWIVAVALVAAALLMALGYLLRRRHRQHR